GTVRLQSWVAVDLRTMMWITFAIDTQDDPLRIWLRSGVPAVDLRQHRFHLWIAQLVFRVPPVKRTQWFVERIVGVFRFGNETQAKLMHKPRIGSSITGRVNCFLTPLQKTLRVGERAFLFRVTRGRK